MFKFVIVVYFLSMIGCSKQYKYKRNMLNSSQNADFSDFISWQGDKIDNINLKNWKTFSKKKLKRVIELGPKLLYNPSQGSYGSCMVNSAANALSIIGIIIYDFNSFLNESKKYSFNAIKDKSEMQNEKEKYIYDAIVSSQDQKFKDNEVIQNIRMKDYFANGCSLYDVSNFLNIYIDYIKTERKVCSLFSECITIIERNIEKKLPVIALFRAGKNNNNKPVNHAMNIIGYNKTSNLNSSKLFIFNTWGGYKSMGIMKYSDTKNCLNIDGHFYLLLFSKSS